MLDGELYDAVDEELSAMRLKCRQLLYQFNHAPVHDVALKQSILQALLAKKGLKTDVQAPFYCDYGSNIIAGDNLFINFNCIILDCAKVTLGENVFVAPNVQL